jgi:hypothetical protein
MEGAMKASVVDIRYKMNDILKALDRNEDVELLYHGKPKGTLVANRQVTGMHVIDHPYFSMAASDVSVDEQMDRLRGGRYRDL